MAFLEINDVRKQFAQASAVELFNLQVERGEFVSFLGPSGCGKTTTLRMIAGFETPTSGTIKINGVDITNAPANRRPVGMVFQAYALFPNMKVADNIAFGLKIARKPQPEIQQRIKDMLALIHMEQFGDRYPYQLSGGQQQRVDAKIRVQLRQEIRSIQRKLGITTIYVTHDQEEALSLSDRIVVMSAGRVEQVGSPFEIYNFPQSAFVAQFVGTLNALKAVVRDAGAGRVAVDGQEISMARPLDAASSGDVISLALRPEMISLDGATQQTNHLTGRIDNIMFLGSIVRVQIRLEQSALFFDTFNNPNLSLPQSGQTVTVSFPREACLLLGSAASPTA
ncbi:MAG: ABC transporter ATP-binding protein [Chloroflexi bacterium]|nr:MAG: ABC transporter ATP-binding protein [Chloroflexota bacterium]